MAAPASSRWNRALSAPRRCAERACDFGRNDWSKDAAKRARGWNVRDPVSVQGKVTAIHGRAAGGRVAADLLRRPAVAGGQRGRVRWRRPPGCGSGSSRGGCRGGLFGPVRPYPGNALPRWPPHAGRAPARAAGARPRASYPLSGSLSGRPLPSLVLSAAARSSMTIATGSAPRPWCGFSTTARTVSVSRAWR